MKNETQTIKKLNNKLIIGNLGFIKGYCDSGIKRYKLFLYKQLEIKDFNSKEDIKSYVLKEVLKE